MADNDDNVWISREEYERLQEYVQYVQKQSPQTYVAPHSYEQSYVQTGGSYKVKPAQIVAGVPLAICFVISLSSPTKPILWTITIVLFSIYVLMVYYDYFQTKRPVMPKADPENTGPSLEYSLVPLFWHPYYLLA